MRWSTSWCECFKSDNALRILRVKPAATGLCSARSWLASEGASTASNMSENATLVGQSLPATFHLADAILSAPPICAAPHLL